MNVHDIIRAWRDREFHEGLSSEEQTKLPENPAGEIELFEEELNLIEGGSNNGCGGSNAPTFHYVCQR